MVVGKIMWSHGKTLYTFVHMCMQCVSPKAQKLIKPGIGSYLYISVCCRHRSYKHLKTHICTVSSQPQMAWMYMGRCAGFGWGRVNFLHSSWCKTMFWICAGISVVNIGIMQRCFSLLQTSTGKVKAFSIFITPYQQVGWECIKSWEDTQLVQLTTTNQRDISYHMTSC